MRVAGPEGLNPRPITIHFGLSAGSSRSSIPLPSILYYNSHSGFLRMARLFVRPMVGQLKAFRRLGRHFFSFSSPPLSPPPHLPRYFSDYGNLVIRGTDGGPRPPPIILELFLSRGGCVWFASKICPKFLNIFRRLFDEYLALHIEINNWRVSRRSWSFFAPRCIEDLPNFECNLYFWWLIFWFWRRMDHGSSMILEVLCL